MTLFYWFTPNNMIAFNMKYPGQLLNAALSWQTNRRQSKKKSRYGKKHNVKMAAEFQIQQKILPRTSSLLKIVPIFI